MNQQPPPEASSNLHRECGIPDFAATANSMDVYRFARRAGIASIVRGHWKIGLKRFLYPTPYWRHIPFNFVRQLVPSSNNLKVLDIGSPKLLSLYLAANCRLSIHATDIQDPTLSSVWRVHYNDWKRFSGPTCGNYEITFADARSLPYADRTFDLAYSISVLEHIPDDGDTLAVREIFRILRKGGVAVLELPYSAKSYESYVHRNVYEREYTGEALFYERHYDGESLDKRIVIPSGLRVIGKIIYGERRRFHAWWNRLPTALVIPFLPLEARVARRNLKLIPRTDMERDSQQAKRQAMAVIVVLQKVT